MTTKKPLQKILKICAIILLVILLDATITLDWSINDLVRFARGTQPNILQPPTQNAFFFQMSPPWGTAVLDGQPLMTLPHKMDQAPLSLPIGTHTLQWRAEPFAPQGCTFTVPVTTEAKHSCQLTAIVDASEATATYMVELPVRPTLNSLLPQQRQALVQAVQRYLDTLQAHDNVKPGEPFRYNASSPALTFSQPLSAHLRFLLDTNTTTTAACQGPLIGIQCHDGLNNDCRLFCTQISSQPGTLSGKSVWEVFVVTRPTWDYRQLDGSPVPLKAQISRRGDQQYTLLQVFWDQYGWHVTSHRAGDSSFDDPNCTLMISHILDFSSLSSQKPAPDSDVQVTVQHWTFTSAQNRALGCLSTINAARATGSLAPALFLWRFGVFLAANPVASSLEPHIPLVDASIKQKIQAIKDHPAFIS